ncbi:MAG: hypothetical protein GX432_11495 [Candidatus Atribacteria bacterium]|nr:hypothetical protein [Candidatus Atribacteria bacterium]
MKTIEKYLQIGFVAILAFCIYLGLNVYDRTFAPGTDIEPIPAFTRPESNGLQFEPPKIDNNEIFLVAYQNESISGMRNIFRPRLVLAEARSGKDDSSIPLAIGGGDEIVTVRESTTQNPQPKNVVAEKKEEPLPDIVMKGVVLSDNKQAIILSVDGKIEILTSQKPLQSGFELVKVSKEEAVLAYKGREITLKF